MGRVLADSWHCQAKSDARACYSLNFNSGFPLCVRENIRESSKAFEVISAVQRLTSIPGFETKSSFLIKKLNSK